MKVEDVVKRVRSSAGDLTALQFDNSTLLDWINDGVRECVIENNLLQARARSRTSVGRDNYNLPDNIFKIHSVTVDGMKLEVLTLEQWEERNASESGQKGGNNEPFQCYIFAGVLTLWPPPATEKELVINYTKMPPSIKYNESPEGFVPCDLPIPEAFHNRIVTYCLAQVAFQDDDFVRYQSLMLEFTTGMRDLKNIDQTEDLYPFISVSSRDMGETFPRPYFY